MNRLLRECCLLLQWLLLLNSALSQSNTDSLKSSSILLSGDTNEVKALIQKGQNFHFNLPDSAAYYYKKAKEVSLQIKYPTGLFRSLSDYAVLINAQGKTDEALQTDIEALDVCEKYKLNDRKPDILINIGTVYQAKENYNTAAEYYIQALQLLEHAGKPSSLSLVSGNLSAIYTLLIQPEKALQYGRKAIMYAEKSKDNYVLGMTYIKQGAVFPLLQLWDSAVYYQDKAYAIGKKTNNLYIQEAALVNKGDVLIRSGSGPDKILFVFNGALQLADSLNDIPGKSIILQGIATGIFLKKQFKKAEKFGANALAFARSNNQKETEKNALLLMSDIQIALGNLVLSQQYRTEYDSLSTALTGIGLQKNVQELETKYNVAKNRAEILNQKLVLEQKNRETLRQKTWLIILAAAIVLFAAALLTGYRFYRQKQLLNKKALKTAETERENVRLKASLDGQLQERQRISREMHDDMGSGLTSMLFLSRTLQSNDMTIEKIKDTAADLVQKMNEIIWTMNHEEDTLDSLIAYIRSHVADKLEEAGIGFSFTVAEPIPQKSISQEFRRNIYLTVKEAIHNIIKHSGASNVNIAIDANNDLQIAVSDNGRGMPKDKMHRFGNGLKNMQYRMEHLGGVFNITADKETCIMLRVPFPDNAAQVH